MFEYLIFGCGMYVGMALNNPQSFTKADSASLIRGAILCFLIWPIGLISKLIMILLEPNEPFNDGDL